jgi:hypothetical protein
MREDSNGAVILVSIEDLGFDVNERDLKLRDGSSL